MIFQLVDEDLRKRKLYEVILFTFTTIATIGKYLRNLNKVFLASVQTMECFSRFHVAIVLVNCRLSKSLASFYLFTPFFLVHFLALKFLTSS